MKILSLHYAFGVIWNKKCSGRSLDEVVTEFLQVHPQELQETFSKVSRSPDISCLSFTTFFRRLPFELERPQIKPAPEIKHVHLALSKFRNNSTI